LRNASAFVVTHLTVNFRFARHLPGIVGERPVELATLIRHSLDLILDLHPASLSIRTGNSSGLQALCTIASRVEYLEDSRDRPKYAGLTQPGRETGLLPKARFERALD
jgi:hypothetical protein